MFNPGKLNEIAQSLYQAIPEDVRNIDLELQNKFNRILQSTFAKFDLVTREEFDIQTKVLARSRAKLDSMEREMASLEDKLLKKDE